MTCTSIFDGLIPETDVGQPDFLNDRLDLVWTLRDRFNQLVAHDLFANDYNLTQAVYGAGNYTNPVAFGLNERGLVLWRVKNSATGLQDIWLSTPVPEPMTWFLTLAACLPLVCRKRSAH